MARAGYDPRDMANMFQTIQAKGGEGRTRVAEQPSQPEQPLRGDQPRKSAQLRVYESDPQHGRVHPGEVAPAAHGAGADDRTGMRRSGNRRTHRRTNGRLSVWVRSAGSSRRRAAIQTFDGGNLFRIAVSVELARASGEQLCDVCARRRLRRLSRTERLHARLAGWHRGQQRAQSSHRDQSTDSIAGAEQSATPADLAASATSPSAAAPAWQLC